jgi:hypothetical protein
MGQGAQGEAEVKLTLVVRLLFCSKRSAAWLDSREQTNMALSTQIPDAIANAMCSVLTPLCNGGTININNGTQPANVNNGHDYN